MKRTPIRRVSKKRASKMRARSLAVEVAMLRDRHCRGLDLIPGHRCQGPLVGHEPLKRSAGGDACDPDEVMMVCSRLNSDIEDYPELAEAFGLTISMSSRYENGRLVRRDTAKVPLLENHPDLKARQSTCCTICHKAGHEDVDCSRW